MSVESAKACIERMKTDEDFAKKVMSCPDADARMACVKAAGFDFTAEELTGLVGAMSEDELENVTGGMPSNPVCPFNKQKNAFMC